MPRTRTPKSKTVRKAPMRRSAKTQSDRREEAVVQQERNHQRNKESEYMRRMGEDDEWNRAMRAQWNDRQKSANREGWNPILCDKSTHVLENNRCLPIVHPSARAFTYTDGHTGEKMLMRCGGKNARLNERETGCIRTMKRKGREAEEVPHHSIEQTSKFGS